MTTRGRYPIEVHGYNAAQCALETLSFRRVARQKDVPD